MKKLTAFLLCAVLLLSLAACGGETAKAPETETAAIATDAPATEPIETEEPTTAPTEPPASCIEITGVFYGNFGTTKDRYDYFHAPEGKDDLFIFFTYTNDEENRTMPGGMETNLVTLSLNEGEPISAARNPETVTMKGDSTLIRKEYDYFDRYTGYRYALGFGNLLGGAEPVQMYVRFFVDPGSLDGQEVITLDVNGQLASFSSSEIQNITMPDEILSMKGDYETAQQLAAFKWRIDKAFMATTFLAEARANYGSDYSSMSEMMKNIFAENTGWGVTIFQASEPSSSFYKVDGITFDKALSKELPSFDLSVVLAGYPDQAEAIQTYVDNINTLAQKIVNSGSSYKSVGDLINQIRQEYYDLCAAFEIDPIQYNG